VYNSGIIIIVVIIVVIVIIVVVVVVFGQLAPELVTYIDIWQKSHSRKTRKLRYVPDSKPQAHI